MLCTITCRRFRCRYRKGLTHHLIRVAPLVVVPAHDLDQITVDDTGEVEVDDGRPWIADDVGRNQRIMRDPQHPGVALRFRFFSEDLVYFVDRGLAGGKEREVGDRSDRNRCPDGDPIESTDVLRKRTGRRERSTGCGGHEVRRRRATPTKASVRTIDD